MNRQQLLGLILSLWLAGGLVACKKDDAPAAGAALTLRFSQKVGNANAVENGNYNSPNGEAFTLTNFQFYLSNLALQTADGKWQAAPNSYYLVSLKVDSSRTIALKGLPAGDFTGLRFLLGVDSTRNVSGVQTGALDPLNGMFWTWNSGYIMAKLEGRSPASTAPANSFSWHVGGFRTGNSVLKTISLAFPSAAKSGATVDIEADALKWFSGSSNLLISADPICHNPGPLAMRLADNYAQMFTLKTVTQP